MNNRSNKQFGMATRCDAYNKDNKDKKDKEDNKVNWLEPSIGLEAEASQEQDVHLVHLDDPSRKGLLDPRSRVPEKLLVEDEIRSSICQWIDNGPNVRQRYKLKIRINLYPKGDVEFIASMGKHLPSFKRHIPGPNRQEILDLAVEIQRKIKAKHGHLPYIGKFHLKGTSRTINIEPDTFAAVWWNPEYKSWQGILKIQNWWRSFDLHEDRLTKKQIDIGVKGQDVFTNPKYDRRVRPLTWAQRRQMGLA